MSLVDDVLAALLGDFNQDDRLLRLTTPLGADTLLAERLDGVESIGPAADALGDAVGDAPAQLRLTLHALSTNAHLDFKQLIGQPVLLELLTQASRTALRPWHGHVTQVALEGSDGGLARYRLTIEPWLAFLGHRQDSWVFQDRTVVEIVEEVFADYQGQGSLLPAWRWALADETVYPRRSLCIQYQESDLSFVQRLLREEGLFCWFEHAAQRDAPSLGSHTLVIADHNNAFADNTQPLVRYTQSGSSLEADSLVRWQRSGRVQTARLALASPDYRAGPQAASLRPAQSEGSSAPVPELALTDVPGQYAYEDSAQGERLALRQMQALDAQRAQARGRGPWRTAAPGTLFTLVDHPVHDGLDAERDRFCVLGVRHRARNNLRADLKAGIDSLLGAIRQAAQGPDVARTSALPNASAEPLYEATLVAQRAAVPVRMAAVTSHGIPDPRLHPRPTVHGVQTALVVGLAAPVHTDRDHRVKVQFHWQRGGNASHRLTHPGGDNAPASDAAGTWVRVAESLAGGNWGSVFVPRLGQEVLVGFVAGDIDRPVVLGAVYNGSGQADAQGNQQASGAAGASGNAPAWFPGAQAEGALQAHQHGAVMAGHKSQELVSSASGAGGFNQLVFDDSAGQGRIELATSMAQTRLQLGHLLHQSDNRRLQPRGHGLDLVSQAWGAVRAGSGLLLGAHGKPASTGTAMQMDSREPQTQLAQATELAHALAESAQQHNAKLDGEPDTVGAKKPDASKQLGFEQGLYASQDSLAATQQQGGSDAGSGDGRSGDAGSGAGGGTGTATVLGRPDLVIAAPAGIAALTPGSTVASVGRSATFVAGQDLQLLAQRDAALAVKDGIVVYTYGLASDASKPNTETGIALHAASGSVVTQSQTAATRLTADKAVSVASTSGMVRVTAPQHVLLTVAGAAIRIEGGNITLSGPGKVEFRASMKELAGPRTASVAGFEFTSAAMQMPMRPLEVRLLDADEQSPANEPVTIVDAHGVEHAITLAGKSGHIANFKPGLARMQQPKRKEG